MAKTASSATASTVSSSTPVAVTGLGSGVTDVAVGFDFSCALLSSGAVKCWGGNTDGDVGDGTGSGVRTSPVTVIASGAIGHRGSATTTPAPSSAPA